MVYNCIPFLISETKSYEKNTQILPLLMLVCNLRIITAQDIGYDSFFVSKQRQDVLFLKSFVPIIQRHKN